MDYDIQQHELVVLNPAHDLSSLDMVALTLIATHPCPTLPPQAALPSPKCPFLPDTTAPPSKKWPRITCFHCGGSGHLPGDCHADSTVASQWAAPIATNAKSRHALLAPNGRQFCFNWARQSSCAFGSGCNNFHGCSICGATNHGAGGCQST